MVEIGIPYPISNEGMVVNNQTVREFEASATIPVPQSSLVISYATLSITFLPMVYPPTMMPTAPIDARINIEWASGKPRYSDVTKK